MTTTGTWYPPSLGTGGFLHEDQLFTNPPFKMTNTESHPQCPPLPDDVADTFWQSLGSIPDRLHAVAAWGFTQGLLAAAQRPAAEERQKGADEELEACLAWMRGSQVPFMPDQAAVFLRAARRPVAPAGEQSREVV